MRPYIKIHPIKKTVGKTIKYITDPKKTEEQELIADSGCGFEFADNIWENTRIKFDKNNKNLSHHVIQSFDPKHNITKEEAFDIGIEFAQKQFGKLGFDYIVATHTDTGIIHNHILINSVSKYDGRKYLDNKQTYHYLRKNNIDVCRDHGIDAIDTMNKGKIKGVHYTKTKAYDMWLENKFSNVSRIRKDVNSVIKIAKDFDDFIDKMKEIGYEIKYKNSQGGYLKHIAFKPLGAVRFKRDRSLGDAFARDSILRRIEVQCKKQSYIEELNRKRKIEEERKSNSKYRKNFINPKWDIRKKLSGEVKYRKRSFFESIIVKAINNILRDQEKYSSEKSFVTNQIQKQQKRIIQNTINQYTVLLTFMNEHKLNNFSDVNNAINILNMKVDNIDKNFNEINERIAKYENFIKLIEMKYNNQSVFEMAESLEGKEKNEYIRNHKNEIENYKVSSRYLEKSKIDITRYEEYKQKYDLIIEKVKELKNERNCIVNRIDKYNEFKDKMRNIYDIQVQKEREDKKEKSLENKNRNI